MLPNLLSSLDSSLGLIGQFFIIFLVVRGNLVVRFDKLSTLVFESMHTSSLKSKLPVFDNSHALPAKSKKQTKKKMRLFAFHFS